MHLREVDANLLVILDALLVDASVTRAAERLGRSASAISHALAKLREIFADELFVRAGPAAGADGEGARACANRPRHSRRHGEPAPAGKAVRSFRCRARFCHDRERGGRARSGAAAQAAAGADGAVGAGRLDAGPGPETIEALRQGRSHFAIDIEQTPLPAPDIRGAQALRRPPGDPGAPRPSFERRAGRRRGVRGQRSYHGQRASDHRAARPGAGEGQASAQVVGASALGARRPPGRAQQRRPPHLASLPAAILETQFSLARVALPLPGLSLPVRLLWHSSYDRDECHRLGAGRDRALARETPSARLGSWSDQAGHGDVPARRPADLDGLCRRRRARPGAGKCGRPRRDRDRLPGDRGRRREAGRARPRRSACSRCRRRASP